MRPVVDIVRPSALAGQTNGKLDGWVLAECDELGHLLETNAARAWKHMVAAAWLDNVFLTVDNAYRSYAEQVNLFTARYSQTWQTTNPVYWDGNPWWKLPGAITAAVPGTSNHGWGLAVDVHTDATNVKWLEQHEVEFGWSHEAGISESEPWHVHYFAGDTFQPEDDDMAMSDDDMRRLAGFIAEALDARPRSVHSYRDGGQYNVNAKTLAEYEFAEVQQGALAAQGQQPK